MVRVVKDYDERYAEFLDVARGLFYSKGYESTSVQEIIKMIGVAKGTFYHYFSSKVDLLEAIVERSYEETNQSLDALVVDEDLGSVDKLEQFFISINDWKIANRDFLIETTPILYTDDNVLLRSKMRDKAQEVVAPVLGQIIQQGKDKGIFAVDYPLATAELIISMLDNLSESAVFTLLKSEPEPNDIEHIKQKIMVFNRSVERVLGLPEGLLILLEPETIDLWLDKDKQ